MSSIASSPLTLELRPPALGPFTVIGAWLALIVASIWCSSMSPVVQLAATAALGGLASAGLYSQLSEHSPRTLVRAVLQPDGGWMLTDVQGRQWSAVLSAGARVGSTYAFLRWRTEAGCRWALLSGGPDPALFRRLRVRLRFS